MATPNAVEKSPEGSAAGDPAVAGDGTVTIETRFGPMDFDRANSVTMPQGFLGFAEHKEFGLAGFDDPRFEQFKLMQSLTDPKLSFLLLPLDLLPDAIARKDLEEAFETLSIPAEDAGVLLVVNARKGEETVSLCVNLRAPVIIDTRRRTGRQHVLPDASYPIRHVLSQGKAAAST